MMLALVIWLIVIQLLIGDIWVQSIKSREKYWRICIDRECSCGRVKHLLGCCR